MKRRDFIRTAGAGAALGAVGAAAPAIAQQETVKWKMVTTWPKNFPGLGTGAEFLAQLIGQMTGGRCFGAANTSATFGTKEDESPMVAVRAVQYFMKSRRETPFSFSLS